MHHVAVPDRTGELGVKAAPLFGHTGRAGQPGQAVLLQQPVNRRARQAVLANEPGGFEQTQDLANRASRVVALGRKDCLLDLRGDPGATAIDAGLGLQARDALAPPQVKPGLDRLLGNMAPLRAGDGVLVRGQLADELLQLTVPELLAADHGAQHGQTKQRLRINLIHQ